MIDSKTARGKIKTSNKMKIINNYITNNKSLICVIVFACYAAFFIPAHNFLLERLTVLLSLIPIVITANFYGLKGGVLAAVIVLPVNVALFLLSGESVNILFAGRESRNFWAMHIVFLALGIIIGRMRDLSIKLQVSFLEIKVLKGLLPICSSCGKIRNDEGYWEKIEGYITKHTEADFTHTICKDCAYKLYPDIDSEEIE